MMQDSVKLLFVTEFASKGAESLGGIDATTHTILEQYDPSFKEYAVKSLFAEKILPTAPYYEEAKLEALAGIKEYIDSHPELKAVITFGSMVSSIFTGKVTNPRGKLVLVNELGILPELPVQSLVFNPDSIGSYIKTVVVGVRLATNPFRGVPVVEADSTFLKDNLSAIKDSDILAYDTETNSLDPYSKQTYTIGVSLSWADNKACFVPLKHTDLRVSPDEINARIELIKEILEDSDIPKVAQNGKFDRQILKQCLDIEVSGDYADTMLDHHILDENNSHSLSSMTDTYLPEYMGYDSLMSAQMAEYENDMTKVPLKNIVGYACGDAIVTYKLHHIFEEELEKEGQLTLARELAMPANLVYTRMEQAGVALDKELMDSYIIEYGKRLEDLKDRLYKFPVVVKWQRDKLRDREYLQMKRNLQTGVSTGFFLDGKKATEYRIKCLRKKIKAYEDESPFNPASSKQVITMYYHHCGLPVQKKYTKTRTGKEERVSAGKEARKALLQLERTPENSDALDLVEFMEEYNKLEKLFSSFVRDYQKHIRDDGLVHTSFNQAVTRTGRLSNSNPNLQQVPKLTKAGEEEPEYTQWLAKNNLKKAYISKFENGLIINADFSQLELRIMTCLSGDQRMLEAYLSGGDLHAQTGKLMHPDYDMVSDELRAKYRSEGKTKNFASVYAMAKDFLNLYPGLRDWVVETKCFIEENGYSYNPFYRKRHLPDLHEDYNGKMKQGVNAVIQSTGHDMLMRALIKLDKAFTDNNLKSHIIFEVHDSIVVDCYAPEKDIVARLMKGIMEDVSDLPWIKIPILVDVEGGETWGTAEPILVA